MTALEDNSAREATNARISIVVRVLMTMNGIRTQATVAEAVGMGEQAFRDRMSGRTDWKAAEVPVLADYFSEPISAFYSDPKLLSASGYKQTSLSAVTGDAGEQLEFPLDEDGGRIVEEPFLISVS